MKYIFTMFLMLTVFNTIVQAQFSNYEIGATHIGYDSLYATKIGNAITPSCARPGPCGNTCAVYTFKGAGNWNIAGNWESHLIPPAILSGCTQIIINPAGANECLLNIPYQVIPAGTSITVMPGKRFRIPGKLEIK